MSPSLESAAYAWIRPAGSGYTRAMGHALLRPYEVTWEDWLLGGGARGSFADPARPLEIEIGPGDDDFLQRSARAHPATNWLGIEYSHKRVRRYVRRVERTGAPIDNLRLIWRPAADLIAPFLTPAQVTAFHIYFPDPWPKAHHARYRLLGPAFLADVAAALEPEGRLHFATDSLAYAEAVRDAAREVPALLPFERGVAIATSPPAQRTTVFEERWRAEGREIFGMRYRREDA